MLKMLAERIREARDGYELSHAEMSEICKIPEARIAAFEEGTTLPTAEELYVIADKMSVSADYLLGLKDITNLPLDGLTADDEENLDMLIEVYKNAKQKRSDE